MTKNNILKIKLISIADTKIALNTYVKQTFEALEITSSQFQSRPKCITNFPSGVNHWKNSENLSCANSLWLFDQFALPL